MRKRADATGALFDGSKHGKRIQRVHSPECIVSIPRALWGGTIVCDPCSSPDPDNLVDALIRIYPPANGCRYVTKIPTGETDADGRLVYEPAPPGLPVWPRHTYLNPEFGDIEPWLAQFAESWEAMILAPARGHRKWYRKHLRGATIADLNPIKFVGHDQTFPAPLVLAYRGDRPHVYSELVTRSGIGEVR